MAEAGFRLNHRPLVSVTSVWAVQIVGMAVQLFYAGVTARAFDSEAFGAYAAAMATLAIATLFAVSGFTKAAARSVEDDTRADRILVSAALIVAVPIMAAILLLAGQIADVWGITESAAMMRFLAVSLPLSAYGGVLLGVLRRRHKVLALNVVNLGATLTGIGAGLVAVRSSDSPLALVVMPVTLQLGTLGMCLVALKGRIRPALGVRGVLSRDVRFSMRSSSNSALTYVAMTFPLIVLGRAVGSGALGDWNRATTLTQVPVESATTAWTTIFFSRLRGVREGSAARRAQWTDMVVISAVATLPPAGALLASVPAGVRILLGPSWSQAAAIAAWLWLASCVVAVAVVLFTALEATDNFSVLWLVQGWRLVVLAVACVSVAITHEWIWLAAGMLASAVGSLGLAVVAGARRDLIDGGRVGRSLGVSAGLALLLSMPGQILAESSADWIVVAAGILLTAIYLTGLYILRNRIASIRLT